MTHYTDTDLLIVKLMPSGKQELAHLIFSDDLRVKLYTMIGMSHRELRSFGGTRYLGNISSKGGNSCFKSSSRKKGNQLANGCLRVWIIGITTTSQM
jgi:hypothetical protein